MMELKTLILLLISSSLILIFAESQEPSSSPSPSPSSKLSDSSISYSPTPTPTPTPTQSPSSPDVDSSASTISASPSPSIENEAEAPSSLPLLFKSMPMPPRNPNLIKVCSATDHPEECLTSISPFQTGESDPVSVLKMEMQALHQGFEKALAKATQLSQNPDISDSTKGSLETCMEMYDSGLIDLEDAITAISTHDINKLKTVLSATISDIDTCEEAFMEESDADSPMKDFDDELTMIASNNLAIANALLR